MFDGEYDPVDPCTYPPTPQLDLDAMSMEELRSWYYQHKFVSLGKWACLLQGDWTGHAIQKIAETLEAYAMARLCMLELEAEGEHERAAVYAQHCAIYFDELPRVERWR